MNLFTYGSLMFAEVWSQLVRGDYVKRPARLHGFTRRRVHGDVYPVIFKSNNGEWDPQWFAREALPIFIHNYRGFARR